MRFSLLFFELIRSARGLTCAGCFYPRGTPRVKPHRTTHESDDGNGPLSRAGSSWRTRVERFLAAVSTALLQFRQENFPDFVSEILNLDARAGGLLHFR
jgi:hypothetical protein